jgi:hypothetical protein
MLRAVNRHNRTIPTMDIFIGVSGKDSCFFDRLSTSKGINAHMVSIWIMATNH